MGWLLVSLALQALCGPAVPYRATRAAIRCQPPQLGPRVRLISVGRNKESWLEQAVEIYTSRLRQVLSIEFQWVRDDAALETAWRKAQEAEPCILLDERGTQLSSVEFSAMLFDRLEEGGSRLTFVIGGAEGLPRAVKASASRRDCFSLGRLTYTHQIARLLLVEQIYRAAEIRRGSGYHKD
ncbi:hypothetical protein AB1Y20_018798 [Prymnesium parvum]|uniref:Uncharacterized protein n=1 Tax=Prymnesium parvum TaxID=97485 RepID=A0AB34JQH1_PRYPA